MSYFPVLSGGKKPSAKKITAAVMPKMPSNTLVNPARGMGTKSMNLGGKKRS